MKKFALALTALSLLFAATGHAKPPCHIINYEMDEANSNLDDLQASLGAKDLKEAAVIIRAKDLAEERKILSENVAKLVSLRVQYTQFNCELYE